MESPINDLVKHVLLQYKAVVEGLNAYDPADWEFPPDSTKRNLTETLSALSDAPNDWLPASREAYLTRHGRTLCRVFAWYGFELKKQLGEEWKEINARLKEEFQKRGVEWKQPPARRVEIEPNLERHLRAEVELISKLKREFCGPYNPPSSEQDYVQWALGEWKNRHKSDPENQP